jgi:hypothetical protein
MEDTVCQNCGSPIQGRYCGSCGQKVTALNPALHEFVHDFTHEMLHVDGKIFRSVRQLLFSPGLLTRDHFEGRRARWISPIRLYLIFSLVYFSVSAIAPSSGSVRVGADSSTELRDLGFENEREMQAAVNRAIVKWAPRAMFVLVPLFAALVHLAWRRSIYNYPQHLYFALHTHAVWFASGALVAASRWIPVISIARAIQLVVVVYGGVYLVMAFQRVYDAPRGRAIGRAALVVFLYWLAVIAATLAIALPVVFGRRYDDR